MDRSGVCMTYSKIDIGMETFEFLKGCSQKEILDFKCGCLKFYKALVGKLFDKPPLNYEFTKNSRCLNPNFMISNKTIVVSLFQKKYLYV